MLQEMGLDAVIAHNHELAAAGVATVAAAIGGVTLGPVEMGSSMASVRLPTRFGTSRDDAQALRNRLLHDHHIELHVAFREGRTSIRLAAQIYNELADYERLAHALSEA